MRVRESEAPALLPGSETVGGNLTHHRGHASEWEAFLSILYPLCLLLALPPRFRGCACKRTVHNMG
jgi:hypothetical protein